MRSSGRLWRRLHDWRVGVVVVLVWGAVVVVGVRGADAAQSDRSMVSLAMDWVVPGSAAYSFDCFPPPPYAAVIRQGSGFALLTIRDLEGRTAQPEDPREAEFVRKFFPSGVTFERNARDLVSEAALISVYFHAHRYGIFAPSVRRSYDSVNLLAPQSEVLSPEVEATVKARLGDEFRRLEILAADAVYGRSAFEVLWGGLALDAAGVLSSCWILTALFGLVWRFWPRRRGGCRGCGYDLTGLPTGVCPECGQTPPPTIGP